MGAAHTDKTTWVFDFDGTLLDSMGSFQELAGRVIHETYGIARAKSEELYRATTGLPFCEQLEVLFPRHSSNERAAQTFETLKLDSFHRAMPFPEVIDTLLALQRRDIFIAISSNNSQDNVERMVAELGIPADCLCGWENGHGKGDVHFDRIEVASGQGRDCMLFVGDSLHDAQLASDHNIAFAGRTGTFSRQEFHTHNKDTYVINTLQELL